VLISDAERELLFEKLKLHAAAGRIGVEELERRVAVVALAESREQADVAMADLPAIESSASARPQRPRGRHGEADRPASDWRPTSERFRDPRTNAVMRVWEDPSGGRHYVNEDRS
jgi:Domain of unknown function (DUF1707)